MTVEQVAQMCHEINRAYCQSMGDGSQPFWEYAPDWQVESAIKGVHFHLSNPDAGADASHINWMREKVESGWVYGEVKNPEAKTHPCIVPFDQLPKEQQAKDFLFKQVVHSLKSYITPDGIPMNTETKPLSFGEQLVGISFNPSGDTEVSKAKELSADLADVVQRNYLDCNLTQEVPYSALKTQLYNNAVHKIIDAQMAVVKLLTFKY